MRDLHPDFLAIIQADDITVARLVELDIENAPQYLWEGIGNLQWDGKAFQGLHHLAGISPVKETADAKEQQIALTLNCMGLVDDFASLRDLGFQGRSVQIHYAGISQERNEIIAVETAFTGRMDSLKVSTSAQGSKIELTATNEMAFLKQSWGRFQTDSDHQADYPGDTSRRFIPAIQDLNIRI